MSNEKTKEQLLKDLEAAQKANKELTEVNSELNEKVSEQDAAAAAKVPVITHKKTKYAVRSAACRIRKGEEVVLIKIVDEAGKKIAESEDLDLILSKNGQNILEKV